MTIDCGDAFHGEGFQAGAFVDVGPRTYRVLLCVRRGFNTPHRSMRLYVEPTGGPLRA